MKHHYSLTSLVTLLGAPLGAYELATPAVQDLAAVVRAATDELKRQAPESDSEIAPLDPRLRLAACDRPLQAALPPNVSVGARVNVRVSCGGGPAQWSVTVPAVVSTETPVVIAVRAVASGTVIGADDLGVVTRKFPGTARCCTSDPEQLIGRVSRRSLQADQIVPLEAIETPPAIKRGEIVTVVAALPGVEIRSSGIALGDARPGENVRIRHSTSSKVIQARADTPGVVRVDR